MVTIYLAGTSIRLESKMAVSEYALEKYKMFKEEMPKEFSISKTRRGCFAYLNQHYDGSDVVAQAANLDDENGKIIESLASMKTVDEENLSYCVKALKDRGYDLLADWLYEILAPVLEAQDEEVEKEPQSCCKVDEISVQNVQTTVTMTTIKAYTDLAQSKKLAEILPLESADMYWSFGNIKFMDDDYDSNVVQHIPAWSLAALLSVLPKGTRLLKSATDNTYHCDCPEGNVASMWFDNPVDACYELILKLYEFKML